MKKCVISYIILSYKNLNITLQCIKHLINISKNYVYSIVVVDNNSLLESEINVIKEYTKDVIQLDSNLGYAKANNIGVKYAIKKYNPDFISVLNNDVYISDPFFIKLIENDYKKYNFDILGPQITSPTRESINPFPVITGKNRIHKEIRKGKLMCFIYSSIFLYFLLNIYISFKRLIFPQKAKCNGEKILQKVPLHGCALIFSKNYFRHYIDAFDDSTFLFHEEEFLYARIIESDLISLYDPNLIIYHNEGSSIKLNSKTERMSKKFKEKERIKSLKILERRI